MVRHANVERRPPLDRLLVFRVKLNDRCLDAYNQLITINLGSDFYFLAPADESGGNFNFCFFSPPFVGSLFSFNSAACRIRSEKILLIW